jgi:hypothetical protein
MRWWKEKESPPNRILMLLGTPAAKLKNAEGNADSNENQQPAFTKLATGTRAPPKKTYFQKMKQVLYFHVDESNFCQKKTILTLIGYCCE